MKKFTVINFRKRNDIDDKKTCVVCGNVFYPSSTEHYSNFNKRKTCCKECAAKLRLKTLNEMKHE